MPAPEGMTLFDPTVAEIRAGTGLDRVLYHYVNPADPEDGALAIKDAFPKLRRQVVIMSYHGRPGETYGMDDLRCSEHIRLTLIAQAVGRHIVNGGAAYEPPNGAEKAIMHAEGFAVPDHPHLLRFVVIRHDGQQLYGPTPPATEPPALTTQALTPLGEDLAGPLTSTLQFIDRMAPVLDGGTLSLDQMLALAHDLSASAG